jgi:hypothetical protein
MKRKIQYFSFGLVMVILLIIIAVNRFPVKRIIVTSAFDFSAPRRATLFLPAGSEPQLISISVTNNGASAVRFPRIQVNGKNRYATMKELLGICDAYEDDPQARFLCFSEFLGRELVHIHDLPEFEGDTKNFPETVLEALNYYGYSQCGPTTFYMTWIAQALGYKACALLLHGHNVAEVYLDGTRSILLDANRGFFYPSADYQQLLSLGELKSGNQVDRVVGRSFWSLLAPSDRSLANSFDIYQFSRGSAQRNDRMFTQVDVRRVCDPVPATELPLARFDLLSQDRLTFTRHWDEAILGYVAELTRRIPLPGTYHYLLPYPGLSFTLSEPAPSESQTATLGPVPTACRMIEPRPEPMSFRHGVAKVDLAQETARYTRVNGISLEVQGITNALLNVKMHFAKSLLPDLREGINDIVLTWDAGDSTPPALQVETTYSVLVRR